MTENRGRVTDSKTPGGVGGWGSHPLRIEGVSVQLKKLKKTQARKKPIPAYSGREGKGSSVPASTDLEAFNLNMEYS